ncbi:hypothetical protein, partial [Staphylococcus aureus]
FLMIRRPPRSTRVRSSAASDVYKRQKLWDICFKHCLLSLIHISEPTRHAQISYAVFCLKKLGLAQNLEAVSYTHLRAHETCADLVCRLLLEKKICLLYTSPSPRDMRRSRMPSSA